MSFRVIRGFLLIAGIFAVACSVNTPTPVAEKSVVVEITPASPPTPLLTGEGRKGEVTTNRVEIAAAENTNPISPAGKTPIYSAFDFLRGYLTNRTHAILVEGKPWTNSTLNVQQLQLDKGGVTYWDFLSEGERWDAPSFMWQQDDGKWRPYSFETVRNAAGKEFAAYLLLDRKGPGVMDKLWFTLDAVWMLTTEESRRDVGPIANMDEFLEWGNLEKLGNLRIEVDDRVAYDGAIKDWFSGKALQLTPDLARILTWRHKEFGSSGSIIPVPYQNHLRVMLYGGSKKPKWFLATGVRFPDQTRVKPFTLDLPIAEISRLASNVLQPENYIGSFQDQRAFDLRVQADAPATIQINGAGAIGALQFRVSKRYDPKQIGLKIKYGPEVGVDVPLVAFFSEPANLSLHRSTPLGVIEDGDTYLFYSNFPLPFQSGLTIELTTRNSQPLFVSARIALSHETTNTQLWALYRPTEKLAVYGPDFQVALPGDGKLVGLVLITDDQDLDKIPKIFSATNPKEEDPVKRAWVMGYLEGNLTLADGAGSSRIYGGHEDWADGGFYFNRGYTSPPGGSNRPFGGILRYKDGKDGYATIFRYFNDLSAFRFKNGLQMHFGHGTWGNNFPVRFAATAYYYKEVKGAPSMQLPASEYAASGQ